VQGEDAASQIAGALDYLNEHGDVDVIIVTRGGGSLEDLWAFNEEEVARALFRSAAPTVSGVGHEVDFTIADFVADARAQTPTQAGELVVPQEIALREGLGVIGTRARLAVERQLERARHTLERLRKSRPVERPETLVAELFERCDDVAEGLKFHLYNRCRGWDDSLAALSGRLEALSPLNVLARGYSVTRDLHGRVVQDAALVKEGQELEILLAWGEVGARVVRTRLSEDCPRSVGVQSRARRNRETRAPKPSSGAAGRAGLGLDKDGMGGGKASGPGKDS
jgi:exodeoxyribonuclease VII large subunit